MTASSGYFRITSPEEWLTRRHQGTKERLFVTSCLGVSLFPRRLGQALASLRLSLQRLQLLLEGHDLIHEVRAVRLGKVPRLYRRHLAPRTDRREPKRSGDSRRQIASQRLPEGGSEATANEQTASQIPSVFVHSTGTEMAGPAFLHQHQRIQKVILLSMGSE